MHIAIITAGGAGMFCGSCMHDNSWAKGLLAAGVEVSLLPMYTPIRVDEEDQTSTPVFFSARVSSADLLAATPPVMPNIIRRMAGGNKDGCWTLGIIRILTDSWQTLRISSTELKFFICKHRYVHYQLA